MQANKFKRSAVALAVAGAFGVGAVAAERAGTFRQATAASQPAVVAVASTATSAALPDFADLVAQNGPAVVQISVTKDAHKVRRARQPNDEDDDDSDALPPWFRNLPGMPKGLSTEKVRIARDGLGLHRRRRRHHAHQCARRRWCGRSDRPPHRPARVQGEGAGQRPHDRRRRAQDRREEPPGRQDRQRRRDAASANGSSRSARRSASTTR